MLSKAEAGYREPDLRRPCVMCSRFDGYRGACSIVAGVVRLDATCDQWRKVEDEAEPIELESAPIGHPAADTSRS